MAEEIEEQEELPESMQEDPSEPWIGLRYGCLFIMAALSLVGVAWFVHWLASR